MRLDPLAVINFMAIAFVEPPDEAAGTESRGIDGEIVFDTLDQSGGSIVWIAPTARPPILYSKHSKSLLNT